MNATSPKKIAIVTAAIGQKYLDIYNRTFRESQESFAKKVGCPLYVVTDLIDKTPRGKSWHPAWQALLIFEIPELGDYDYLMWIDGDIYITADAASPFDFIPDDKPIWMAAKNNAYDLPNLAKTDPMLFDKCPVENRPSTMLNLGLFLVDRKTYAPILRHVYDTSVEQACYYQGPGTYAFFASGPGKILPPYFNTILASYMEKYDSNFSTLLRCYRENGFIHFAGGVDTTLLHPIAKYIDLHPQRFLAKILIFFGSEKLEPVNTFVFKAMRKIIRFVA